MDSQRLPRYHLLESALPQEEIPHMLGRCVVDKSLPLHDYVPNASAKLHPENLVPSIQGEKICYYDICQSLNRTENTTARSQLTKLFGATMSHKAQEDLQIEAGTVTRYEMSNAGDVLEILMSNDTYKHQLLKKIEKMQDSKTREKNIVKILPMVVGLLTCKDLKLGFKADKDRGASIQGKLPIGTATGTSSAIDTELEISHTEGNSNRLEGKLPQEVIFALAYDEVRLVRYLQKRCLFNLCSRKQSTSKPDEIKLGDKIRTPDGIKLYFGGQEQSDGGDNANIAAHCTEAYIVPQAGHELIEGGLPFVLCYSEPSADTLSTISL